MKYDEKAMQERYRDAFASPGQSAAHLYENLQIYERYQEYFRGKHYLAFQKQDQQQKIQELGSDPQLQRNEYDPHDIKLSIEQFKIFEIKGYQLSSGSLQHGAQTSGWITFVEEI